MKYFIIISIIATTAFLITTADTQIDYTNLGWSSFIIRFINNFITNTLPVILKNNFTVIKPTSYVFPKVLHYLIEGSANLTKGVEIWGLYNTNTSEKNGEAKQTDNTTKASLWLNFPISEMGIALGYAIDLAILNSLPIYGSGEIVIAVSKVEVNMSLNIICPGPNPLVNLSVEDFNFQKLTIYPSHSYITGFWNNPEADRIISDIVNIVEDVVILFFAAERNCVICVLDAVVEYVINNILNAHPTLNIDCPCLKDFDDGLYSIEDAIYDIVTKLASGNFEEIIKQFSDENTWKFYSKLSNTIYEYVKKEGIVDVIKELVR